MGKLDGKIEEIIELITEGYTYRQIADKLKVGKTTLMDFTAKGDHFARVREAMEYSAESYADKAEQVLIDAKSNLVEVQRARELAQHYRWKASKRSPKRFGDKLEIDNVGEALIKVSIKNKKND